MTDAKILNHLVIIPDGNRRWARSRGLKIWLGHQKGAEQFEEILKTLKQEKIKYLSIWIASENNLLKRSKAEIKFLITIFRQYFKKLLERRDIYKDQVRVRIFGQGRRLIADKELNKSLDALEKRTKSFNKFHLSFLFGYNGDTEMLEAVKKIKKSKKRVTAKNLRSCLWTGDLPDVDFIIRTGGDPHNSAGFMMWHCANSQYYFSNTLWPNFNKKELKEAIKDFQDSPRLMGK